MRRKIHSTAAPSTDGQIILNMADGIWVAGVILTREDAIELARAVEKALAAPSPEPRLAVAGDASLDNSES